MYQAPVDLFTTSQRIFVINELNREGIHLPSYIDRSDLQTCLNYAKGVRADRNMRTNAFFQEEKQVRSCLRDGVRFFLETRYNLIGQKKARKENTIFNAYKDFFKNKLNFSIK